MAVDIFGNEVVKGDLVVCCPPNTNDVIMVATVQSVGPKMIKVAWKDVYGNGRVEERFSNRRSFIKLDPESYDRITNKGMGKYAFVSDAVVEAMGLPK